MSLFNLENETADDCNGVQALRLGGCHLDAGMFPGFIGCIPNIQVLSLYGCRGIGNNHMHALSSLKSLRSLYLGKTRVNSSGALQCF